MSGEAGSPELRPSLPRRGLTARAGEPLRLTATITNHGSTTWRHSGSWCARGWLEDAATGNPVGAGQRAAIAPQRRTLALQPGQSVVLPVVVTGVPDGAEPGRYQLRVAYEGVDDESTAVLTVPGFVDGHR